MRIKLFILSILIPALVFAIPARRDAILHTQPDGSVITLFQHGDEYFHYFTDEQGNWVELNDEGFYTTCQALSESQIQERQKSAPRYKVQQQRIGRINLAPRGLVIMVNFADLAFRSFNTQAAFDEMHNGENYTYGGATGSVREYFRYQSTGHYVPTFDVVGPVTLSKNYKYYGENDSYGSDMHPEEMVTEACKLADELYDIDFTIYDNDGDNFVDFVYVVYAGYGEAAGASANTIWPHNYYVYSGSGIRCVIDGKTIDNYACSSELNGAQGTVREGIGTFCHEFSHVLGLPDLYSTNDALHKTLGSWDILDYGPYNNEGRTPPSYSAYERFFMGWLTPTLLTERDDLTLEDIQTSNQCYMITETGQHNMEGVNPNPTLFYLLECKKKVDWNAYIPGEGLMVTRVNYNSRTWEANTVNNNEKSMGVDIIEADGQQPRYSGRDNGYMGKQGDLFPYDTVTTFIPFDKYPVSKIKVNDDGSISMKFRGGLRDLNQFVTDEDGEEVIEGVFTIDGKDIGTTNLNDIHEEGVYVVKKSKNGKRIRGTKIVIKK